MTSGDGHSRPHDVRPSSIPWGGIGAMAFWLMILGAIVGQIIHYGILHHWF